MKQTQLRKLNAGFTDKVISLHNAGYTEDFFLSGKGIVTCVQNQQCFVFSDLCIRLIDCNYDSLLWRYQYLHTIETATACRGLLITDSILPILTFGNHQMSLPHAFFQRNTEG